MNTVFKHPLERGEKNRIELSIDNWFRNGILKLDGTEIWRFTSEAEFREGARLPLSDGSLLEIQLRPHPNNGSSVIYLARDGDPLPKSAFDQRSQYGQSVIFLRVVAAAYIAGGLLSLIGVDGFLTKWTGGSLFSLIAGVLLIGITFAPDNYKRPAFLVGAVVSLAEAAYFFTHPPLDMLGMILQLVSIIYPFVCSKTFGDAQRQVQESLARKAARQ